MDTSGLEINKKILKFHNHGQQKKNSNLKLKKLKK